MDKSRLLRLIGIAGVATAVILSSYYKGKDAGRKEYLSELLVIDSTITNTVLNVIVEKVYERNFGKGLTKYGFGSDGKIYFSTINGMNIIDAMYTERDGLGNVIIDGRTNFDSLHNYRKRLE